MPILNNITDILESAGRGMQRSFALSLRKECEKLLTKITQEEFSDMLSVPSWGIGDDYLYDVVDTMAEIDMYAIMQDNRWKIQ